jgi:hypothetical protein
MRELVDLQLLEFDFCIALGEDCRVSGIEIGELCVAIGKLRISRHVGPGFHRMPVQHFT